MKLIINSLVASPIRETGRKVTSGGDTWSDVFVYYLSDVISLSRSVAPLSIPYELDSFHRSGEPVTFAEQFDDALNALIQDFFPWGSGGAGQAYSRRPRVRRSRCNRFLLVAQEHGLDI